MARKFLYLVAVLVVLVLAGAVRAAAVGRRADRARVRARGAFVEQHAARRNAYDDPAMWFSRPGIGAATIPRAGCPAGRATPRTRRSAARRGVLRPPDQLPRPRRTGTRRSTTPSRAGRARLFLRGMASPFAEAGEIWAPRYRQATFGAFLTDEPEARAGARRWPMRDVAQAFDYFLASVDPDDADRARRAQPGRAARAAPAARAGRRHAARRRGSRWSMRSAGRSRSSTTCRRSACPPAPRPDQARLHR